jgi:ketosteroid isomerase-like protein
MTNANVEIARRVFDAWARGDFSEGDAFDPDVEFELVDWPEPARTKGIDAMRRAWVATLSAWDDFRAVADDYIDADPHVVVLNHIEGRGKSSGAAVRAECAAIMSMQAGKVVRLALHWDRANALRSLGMPASSP